MRDQETSEYRDPQYRILNTRIIRKQYQKNTDNAKIPRSNLQH